MCFVCFIPLLPFSGLSVPFFFFFIITHSFFIYLKAINDNLVVVVVVPEQLIGGCLLSAPSLFLIVCLFATSVQSFMFFVCVFLLSGGY